MLCGTESARLSKAFATATTVVIDVAFDLHMQPESVRVNVLISIPYVIQIRLTLPLWPCIDHKLNSFLELMIHVAS